MATSQLNAATADLQNSISILADTVSINAGASLAESKAYADSVAANAQSTALAYTDSAISALTAKVGSDIATAQASTQLAAKE